MLRGRDNSPMTAATRAPSSSTALLEVERLTKHFEVWSGALHMQRRILMAVDGVSFNVARGETLCLVGESGCGKSTVGRLLLRLIAPSGGTIRFAGADVLQMRAPSFENSVNARRLSFRIPLPRLIRAYEPVLSWLSRWRTTGSIRNVSATSGSPSCLPALACDLRRFRNFH